MTRHTEETKNIDKQVGANIAKFMRARGYSMVQLAPKLDVTHQQIAKYINGSNRISASKLFIMASVLKHPIEAFFQDVEKKATKDDTTHTRMAIEVSRNFMDIKNTQEQMAINQLVRILARKNNG